MITIKKRVTTQQDAGWHGKLIGLEWQALDREIIETWQWRSPEVRKGPGAGVWGGLLRAWGRGQEGQ